MKRIPAYILALAALMLGGCDWSARTAEAAAQTAVADTNLVVRRVLPETYVYEVFPDGRRVVVTDTIGNLLVEEIGTGRRTPLTTDGSWMERWPESVAVSRDGGRVAYLRNVGGTVLEVRIVGADGGGERTLLRRPIERGWISLADWTTDGRSIAAVTEYERGADRLVTIDQATGAIADVHDFGWRRPSLPRYSPDGAMLALTLNPSDDTTGRDLYVLHLSSGELRRVVDLDDDITPADWAPDGAALYFVTRTDGVATLWRQPLAGAAATGAPQRVRGDLARFYPLTWGGSGLFFSTSQRDISLQHVQLTAGSDAIAAPPATLDGRAAAWMWALTWSPDGQHLAHLRPGVGGDPRIVVHSRAGGDERVFEPAGIHPNGLEWRADGLFVMAVREGRRGLFELDFDSGRLRKVEDLEPLRALALPRASADADVLLLRRSGETPGSPEQLVALDRRTSAERVLLEGRYGTAVISPDGRWVALVNRQDPSELSVVSTESGEAREIYRPAAGSFIKGGGVAWTPDSRAVLILEQHVTEGQANSLFRKVGLDGTVRDVLNAGGPGGAVLFALSSDGRHLAYTSGEEEPRGGLWVIEGLPES